MTITFLAPDGVAITAQQFRQAQAATHGGGSGRRLGGRSGFRVDTPSTVLTATSTTWTLAPCAAMIDPGATTHQGMYGWSSDANATGSVTAADATYARKDIVYIQVNDSSAGDGSGALTANVLYLAGTPAASPVAPTLPVRSFLVGTISVPVAGGGSPTVVLNPARYVAAGGVLPITNAEIAGLTPTLGDQIAKTDEYGRPYYYDGADWLSVAPTYTNWITTDTNWTYGGGLMKTAAFGKTFIQLIGVMYRQAGGSVTVNVGTDVSMGPAFIPAGWRPTIAISSIAPVVTGTTHNAEPMVMVGTDGTLKLHATVANATIAVGAHISFNVGWYL